MSTCDSKKSTVKTAINNPTLRTRNRSIKYIAKRQRTHQDRNVVFVDNQAKVHIVQHIEGFITGRSSSNYCFDCDTMYENEPVHKACVKAAACPVQCHSCFRVGEQFPCAKTNQMACAKCKRTFANEECYEFHRSNTYRWHALGYTTGTSLCDHVFVCACGITINYFVERARKTRHVCEQMSLVKIIVF